MIIKELVQKARDLVNELEEDGFTLIEISLLATLMQEHIRVISIATSIKKIMGK